MRASSLILSFLITFYCVDSLSAQDRTGIDRISFHKRRDAKGWVPRFEIREKLDAGAIKIVKNGLVVDIRFDGVFTDSTTVLEPPSGPILDYSIVQDSSGLSVKLVLDNRFPVKMVHYPDLASTHHLVALNYASKAIRTAANEAEKSSLEDDLRSTKQAQQLKFEERQRRQNELKKQLARQAAIFNDRQEQKEEDRISQEKAEAAENLRALLSQNAVDEAREEQRLEEAKVETDRLAQIDSERIAAKLEEQKRADDAKLERERLAKIEADRDEAALAEQQRLEEEGIENERLAKIEADKEATDLAEQQRLEEERIENARLAKIEADKNAADLAEQQRLEEERIENARLSKIEADKNAADLAEQQRLDEERIENARLAKIEADKNAADLAEQQRLEDDRIEKERLAKIETDKKAQELAEQKLKEEQRIENLKIQENEREKALEDERNRAAREERQKESQKKKLVAEREKAEREAAKRFEQDKKRREKELKRIDQAQHEEQDKIVFEKGNLIKAAEERREAASNEIARWKMDCIVIDAGHGGTDPGTLYNGVMEKDVNLAVALKLGKLISENLNIRVIYTRDRDVLVPLEKRGPVANVLCGKLFVSLHSNGHWSREASGTETYFLGLNYSDAAREVMDRENRVVDYQTDGNLVDKQLDHDKMIRQTLMQSAFLRESQTLSSIVQREFSKSGRISRGVKQAGFIVLYTASMPAVLVELGFLSNSEEARLLSSDKGQTDTAQALYEAIAKYKGLYEEALEEVAAESSSE